jgi:acyl-coenzyme A synthetase/AMP-(fatty) acid ligase
VDQLALTDKDTVLNVFPSNVIAYYTITAGPAQAVGARLITANFDPYNYIKLFNQYRPTVIALIPKHFELLMSTKAWSGLDMSCVRYLVTGSQPVSQQLLDELLSKGIKTIGNWYGSTEHPPPVIMAINSTDFDLVPTQGYTIEFVDGELVVNGQATGDVFSGRNFSHRVKNATHSTWKS